MTDYAKIDVYGNDAGGIRRLLVAKGDPIPDGVTVDPGDKTTVRPDALGVPIANYDALTEADIVERLPGLSGSDLAKVQAYEQAGQARSSITRFGQGSPSDVAVVLHTTMPATGAAADADQTVDEVPQAGTVIEVTYIPEAAIVGANTDSRTVRLINKGAAGAGSTVVATLALTSGVNATAFDEKAVPLSGTPANLAVAAGDVLAWESNHVGSTGLADPGGRVTVKIAS